MSRGARGGGVGTDRLREGASDREILCAEVAGCAHRLEKATRKVFEIYEFDCDRGNAVSMVVMLREAIRRMQFALTALETFDKANLPQ